jgi:plasmid stability protein
MTITVSVPQDVGQKLRARATETGKDVETLIREALEQQLANSSPTLPADAPYERWKLAFDAWIKSHPAVENVVDDSRESIYAGRDE